MLVLAACTGAARNNTVAGQEARSSLPALTLYSSGRRNYSLYFDQGYIKGDYIYARLKPFTKNAVYVDIPADVGIPSEGSESTFVNWVRVNLRCFERISKDNARTFIYPSAEYPRIP